MRNLLRSLRGANRGFNAHGRTLGLGLAMAMAKQRRETTGEVEAYLRAQSDVTPASL